MPVMLPAIFLYREQPSCQRFKNGSRLPDRLCCTHIQPLPRSVAMAGNHLTNQSPVVQKRCLTCHVHSCSSRRGAVSAVAAALLLNTISLSLPAHAANDAVLNQLEQLKRVQGSQEIQKPALSRLTRLEVCLPPTVPTSLFRLYNSQTAIAQHGHVFRLHKSN